MNLLKILLLNDTGNWAGTESHILDLAIALRAQSIDAAIACPPQSPLAGRAGQVPTVSFEIDKLVDRRAIRQLARLLKSGRADVLHAHNGRTQLHGALAVMLARRGKLVWTQHFIAPHHVQIGGRKAAVMKRVHGAVNARTHGFIAISQAVKRAMLERNEAADARIDVVPNGIADPKYANLEDVATIRARTDAPRDAPLVVCLCRLEREKEVGVLLQAWAKVAAQRPDARLIIGGRGALQSELQTQIERENLAESARLVGFVDEPLALIKAADIVVHPAPAEPFGLVFLEAMGLGKPVVACEGGAAPEVVDENCGVLVAPGDSEQMARALGELLNDEARRRQLGRNGRARFEARFTRGRMAQETLAVYQKAAKL